MTHNLKAYPAYIDSGLPWVGDIPEHWETGRLDHLFSLRGETPMDDDKRVTGYLDGRVTLRSNVVGQKIKGVVKEGGWQRVHPGDFAISGMNAHLGGMGVSDSLGKCSPIYLVLEPNYRTNARFVALVVRHAAFSGALKALVNTIRFNSADFKRDDLKLINVLQPPLSEQAAIVRYLDYADRRIRRYIAAKRKLIALLNEQKQAIIHQAVTRGLDPNVRLKPSGVEWLGDVPEHWGVSRLKFESAQIVDCLHATPEYLADGAFPAIRTADVKPGKLLIAGARRVDATQYQLWTNRLQPEVGDILYTREGERYGIAAVVPAGVRLCISQRMMVFRIRPHRSSAYLMWQLNCPHVYAQAAADVIGATAPHVNVERIKNYSILVPPHSEQQAIAAFVKRESEGIDVAIQALEREMNFVREYRTTLIGDVVTGKLDVREAAAKVLDEDDDDVPPAEPDDEFLESEQEAEDADLELIEA